MKKILFCTLLASCFLFNCAMAQNQKCDLDKYQIKGEKYLQQDKLEKFIEITNVCIEQYPNMANLYNNRATAYKNLKKFDLALNDYTKALELNPEYASVYLNRANLYLENSKFKEAVNDYTKAINLVPNFYFLYSMRSTARALDKDFAGAKADNKKARKLGLNKQSYDENNRLIDELMQKAKAQSSDK